MDFGYATRVSTALGRGVWRRTKAVLSKGKTLYFAASVKNNVDHLG